MCMRASLFVAVTECNSYLVVLVLSETERSKTVTAMHIEQKFKTSPTTIHIQNEGCFNDLQQNSNEKKK